MIQSNCCKAAMSIEVSGTTQYYSCTKCHQPCKPIDTHGLSNQADMVHNPSHYNVGKIECIHAIEAALSTDEFRGYCKGNVLKYLWRERHKGGTVDLQKALWYLQEISKGDAQ